MSIAQDINLNVSDLPNDFDIDTIIANAEVLECRQFRTFFRNAYYENLESNPVKAKIAHFLTFICDIYFTDTTQGKNTVGLEYSNGSVSLTDLFDDSDISIIEYLINNTHSAELLSRFYDILWSTKKDFKVVSLALESYFNSIQILVKFPNWIYPLERFKRIISLGRTVNNKLFENQCIEFMIEQSKSNKAQEESFFAINVAEYLCSIGYKDSNFYNLLDICEKKADGFLNASNFYITTEYCRTLAKIYHTYKDYEKEKKCQNSLAHAFEMQGDNTLDKSEGSFKAAHFFMCAAENYKRAGNTTDYERVNMLLEKHQKLGMQEFIQTDVKVDVSDTLNYYSNLFKDLNFYDSLIVFCKYFLSPTEENMKTYIINERSSLSRTLFPNARVNENGKTVATGVPFDEDSRDKFDKQSAFDYLTYHWNVSCNTLLTVFFRHLTLISYGAREINSIVEFNPFIEHGKENYFVEGFLAGFNMDFLKAIHLLVPQFENMLRHILREKGKVVTKLKDGIQEEMDINMLLNNSEYRAILEELCGKSTVLDFEAILIGRMGMNLRNRLAHGLLSYEECFSYPSIYFFGIVVKLICIGWLMNENLQKSEEQK